MKRNIKKYTLLIPSFFLLVWINCGDDHNPLIAPSELAGTWKLTKFTEKNDNITVNADQPTDIGNAVTMTVSGTAVLTETRYDFEITITTEIPGQSAQTEAITSNGTYSVDGSTLTATEDGTRARTVFTLRRNANSVVFEEEESVTEWQKQ